MDKTLTNSFQLHRLISQTLKIKNYQRFKYTVRHENMFVLKPNKMPNIWTTISVSITFSRLKNAEVRRVHDRVNNTCAAHMRSRAYHSAV